MNVIEIPGAPVAGTNEVQTLTIGGTPTGGTFKLRFEGFTTEAIAWSGTNATLLANINTALRALPAFGVSEITAAAGTLTGGIGTVTLTAGGNRGKQALAAAIAVAENLLAGTAPTLAIAVTTPGVSATGRGKKTGQVFSDIANGILYINTGTATSPTLTKVGTQT